MMFCLEFHSCKYDSHVCTFTGTYRHRSTVGCPQLFVCAFWISPMISMCIAYIKTSSIFFSFSHTLGQKPKCLFVKLSALVSTFLPPPLRPCKRLYLSNGWSSERCIMEELIGSSYIFLYLSKLYCTSMGAEEMLAWHTHTHARKNPNG